MGLGFFREEGCKLKAYRNRKPYVKDKEKKNVPLVRELSYRIETKGNNAGKIR